MQCSWSSSCPTDPTGVGHLVLTNCLFADPPRVNCCSLRTATCTCNYCCRHMAFMPSQGLGGHGVQWYHLAELTSQVCMGLECCTVLAFMMTVRCGIRRWFDFPRARLRVTWNSIWNIWSKLMITTVEYVGCTGKLVCEFAFC